jgi:predicted phosphodiesterase
MPIGALGDIHGDFASARAIMQRHPEVPLWLCVGDIADAAGRYESLDAPLYWIKGNNDNFDAIAAAAPAPARYLSAPYYIPNGSHAEIDLSDAATTAGRSTLRIAGLGGTLAPTWYETPAAELPHPVKATARATELADKRRHFVREEVEACKAMRGVDVFLTHEAPRPYKVGRMDAGKTPINEVLASMKPRLHLFGHHHRFSDQVVQGVRSVGLDLVSRSYVLIDINTLEPRKLP